MTVRFVFYSSICNQDIKFEEINLPEYKWTKLEAYVPEINGFAPDCLNLDIIPRKNSYYHNGYDGFDLYMDSFSVSGTPHMHFVPLRDMLNSMHKYPNLANFSVGIGDVYFSDKSGPNMLRFYSGTPYPASAYLAYQELSAEKKMSEALFGCPMKNARIICNMQIAPPKYSDKEPGWIYNPTGASMIIISAKGAADNYAVGFFGGKAGIFRCSTIPGEYKALVVSNCQPDPYEKYHMIVKTDENEITFRLSGSGISEYYSHKEKNSELSGYMDFFSLKNGFTLFDFTIEPV